MEPRKSEHGAQSEDRVVVSFDKEIDDDASSIRSEARGNVLPQGYFYSVGFLGASAVSSRDCLSTIVVVYFD